MSTLALSVHSLLLLFLNHIYIYYSLAEPHAGFRIAFNMFDTDGNEMVDKKEFLVVSILELTLVSVSSVLYYWCLMSSGLVKTRFCCSTLCLFLQQGVGVHLQINNRVSCFFFNIIVH